MPTDAPSTPPLPQARPDTAERLRRLIEAHPGPITTWEQLGEAGRDLWADDAEFDEFMRLLRESRERG